MRGMNALSREFIVYGQVMLIICCLLYCIWWLILYHPYRKPVKSVLINGILFTDISASGILGILVSLYGINTVQIIRHSVSEPVIVIAGGILYVITLITSKTISKRITTAESFLLNGWLILELTVCKCLYETGVAGTGAAVACATAICIAYAVSIALYQLYFRMKPMAGYIAGAVPLITESLCSIILIIALNI
jgi:uncharacterized membrane protein YGL010W